MDIPARIAGFMQMSSANQFAAATNPREWARVQAAGTDVDVDELAARAQEWREFMQAVAREGEGA